MPKASHRPIALILTAAFAGGVATLAYPPYEYAPLVFVSIGCLLWIMAVSDRRTAAVAGLAYGTAFFATLFTWLAELGSIALVPLVALQALFPMVLGLVLPDLSKSPGRWVVAAVGWWSGLEWMRARVPLGGFEWGQAGYAMSPYRPARSLAAWIGTTGWSVIVVAVCAFCVVSVVRKRSTSAILALVGLVLALVVGGLLPEPPRGDPIEVAIVQGRGLCTDFPCDRRSIYLSHLELTQTIDPGAVDLIVWSEGSTGSFDADPILNPDVADSIGAEARRVGAAMLVGSDRPLSDSHWVNANVVFDQQGRVVGEYFKRHPVPFGEFVPQRSWFTWVPGLEAVPRDMVRGDGPVTFDLGFGVIGSVISFEGSFARYPRDEVRAGAQFLVVATSQASYPLSRASDQLIGMTAMRSAELGVDLVHAAVGGRSTILTGPGEGGVRTGNGERTILFGTVAPRVGGATFYVRWGDWLLTLAAWAAVGDFIHRWRFHPKRL